MAVMGRPSTFNQDIADKVVSMLYEGVSLNKACEAVKVARQTVSGWMDSDPDFSAKCARARIASAEYFEGQMIDTLEMLDNGVIEPDAARVKLSTLQWIASKRDRAKFGDKLQVDSDSKVQISVSYEPVPALPSRAIDVKAEDMPVLDADLVDSEEL